MASTPRWGGLRPEPYKQNAVDADGDGIVQEGTAFERPAGTSLLDGAGSPLSDGLSSLERDTSWSVVDRNGQRISYTPSYGGAFEQAKPKTLKDSIGTLAVSLGTIGDRVGTVETSSRSIKAQFGTITEMPEPLPIPQVPIPEVEGVLPARSIKAQQIISKIEESGGTWGKITEDYLNANDSNSRLFFPRITDKDTLVRLERMKYILDDLRELIASQTLQPNNKRIQELDEGSVKYFSPEVLQLVEKMSDEELVGLLTEQAVKFHGGIEKNVRVRVNPGSSFFSILDDGYKTTHEVQSDHSGADIRSQYEVVAGIPLSAPIEVRPASGYIVHPDWREKHLDTLRSAREFRGESGEITEFYDTIRGTASEAGGVGIYGSIEIVLKPEVSERTKFGRGDSLNTILRPTAIDETDKDVIANAIFSADGKEQYYLVPQMASFLQSYIDGNFKKSNLHPMYGDDGLITEFSKDSEFGGREYHEALIFGSFDSSDIQEINVSYEDLFTLAVSSRDQGMDSMNALAEELKSEFLSPNFLDSVGFSQEERRLIDELIEKASRETLVTKRMYKNIPSQISNAFEQLIKFRESKKIRDDIEARGIKINVMSTQNVDMFNAANYRGGSAGDDIEELLYDRSINNLKNSIARELERINNPVTNNFGGSSV